MEQEFSAGPDTARCFGHYRAQTPYYALAFCVKCPKLKPCVRTVWGMELPRRGKGREVWWENSPRGLAHIAQPATNMTDYLAT
jgi:hypothetical protein